MSQNAAQEYLRMQKDSTPKKVKFKISGIQLKNYRAWKEAKKCDP